MSAQTAQQREAPTDRDLRAQAAAGDREAFIHLVERHLDDLYRFAAREIRYRESVEDLEPGELTAEDVISEATLTALQLLKRVPAGFPFKRWLPHLVLALIERAVRHSRERRDQEQVRLERGLSAALEGELFDFYQPDDSLTWEDVIPYGGTSSLEELLALQEDWATLEAALNSLPADQRQVFVLHAIEGLPLKQIAALQRRRLEDVKKLYQEGRESLRVQLVDHRAIG